MILHLHPYPPHRDTHLTLPDKGIVVVQGKNESGKSSILEAYCAALWARSLRGDTPWRCSEALITVGIGSHVIERTPESLTVNSHGALKPSKKQKELESIVGDWDTFQRTRCFDADLSARFGAATDGERRILLERLCGLEKLANGLKRCRDDKRDAEKRAAAIRQRAVVAQTRLAEQPQAEAPAPGALEHAGEALKQAETRLRELAKREGLHQATASQAEQQRNSLFNGKCPTCEQPVSWDCIDSFRKRRDEAQRQGAQARAQREAASAEGAALLSQLKRLQTQQANAQRAAEQAAKRAEIEGERDRAVVELQAAERDISHLSAVESFLIDVRPRLLRSSLASLEKVAQRLIAPLTDKALSLKLDGDEVRLSLGPFSYKQLNRGHRRRVDLCLMLGLSQLYPNVNPIFLDECLDGIDAEGCDAAALVLEAAAERDLIILLTHSVEIAGRLRGTHIEVLDGQCKVRQNVKL